MTAITFSHPLAWGVVLGLVAYAFLLDPLMDRFSAWWARQRELDRLGRAR